MKKRVGNYYYYFFCKSIQIIPIFVRLAKNTYFGVLQNFSNQFTCAMRGKITGLETLLAGTNQKVGTEEREMLLASSQ